MAQPHNQRLCIIGESDLFLARLLGRFAEKSGLAVQFASTGDELAELALTEIPALVILEPELPGKLRGWEAAWALKTHPRTCSIPLLVCSWQEKEQTLAITGPVSAYLKKPDLHYEDFAAALEALNQNLDTDYTEYADLHGKTKKNSV